MKASEKLKNKIHDQINSLDDEVLEEFYCLVTNFINSKRDINDWDLLSSAQQKGILDAIEQVDSGKGKSHEEVISKISQKYSDD